MLIREKSINVSSRNIPLVRLMTPRPPFFGSRPYIRRVSLSTELIM